MIFAGAVSSLFVKRHRHAFLGGFLGGALAWSILFIIHVQFFLAYEIGEFFASIIGAAGFGRYVVSISIILGGLLGGSGALVGWSFIELLNEVIMRNKNAD